MGTLAPPVPRRLLRPVMTVSRRSLNYITGITVSQIPVLWIIFRLRNEAGIFAVMGFNEKNKSDNIIRVII